MHTLDELTVRLLSELIEIAEGLGLKNAKKESKQDLIYKILDIQATLPDSEVSAPIVKEEIKTAPKKRPPNANTKKVNNPKEPSQPTEAKDGTSKLLASLDLNLKDGDKKEDQPSATNTLLNIASHYFTVHYITLHCIIPNDSTTPLHRRRCICL